MNFRYFVPVIVVAIATPVFAQNTTVQLPTFNFTGVSTTVSVPDSGTGYLGGIKRASEGSVTRGLPLLSNIPGVNRLFKNRGIGREFGDLQMTVVPRIIIQEEEEFRQTGMSPEALALYEQQQARAAYAGVDPAVADKANFIARNLARPADEASPFANAASTESVAEVHRRHAAERIAEAREAQEFFAKGQRAEAEGKLGVAKIYYQMAGRRASGDFQQHIAARLASLQLAKDEARLAGR